MLLYVLRRLASAVSVVVATMFAGFGLFFLAPTDAAGAICGNNCSAERIAHIRASLGLDEPFLSQFGAYLTGVLVGRTYEAGGVVVECSAPCLGFSYQLNQPVTALIADALPVTVSIVAGAATVSLTVGVLTGAFAARRRGRVADRVAVAAALGLGSVPFFVVALISALYLAGTVLPRAEHIPISEDPLGWAAGLLAPWLTLGVVSAAAYTRHARAAMIESLGEDYIRTARAKGLSERRVVYRHGLRAAITPVATLFGMDVAFQLTGALFTEAIFGLPGLGVLTLRAFAVFDLPVLMGAVLVGATILVVMNLVVDIAYTVLDPRVRLT
ncbi:ABC transporter permease [Actinokineospora fastidiosa]|uniref:Peptide ABC transporter permease n=1 Tax=Actinokineospora fastidiosa TaxID=1816 RepID=A0A918GSI2_9PSEU|nr:ABC transporter permease [Actinokineospora fastidiosa]GGS56539.1 peptide ABC transporter permease [Actinokineospora fastidiosa]